MFRVYADGRSIFDPANKSMTLHSPKVSLEVGKAGSFTFIMPPTHENFNDIQQLSTSIVVEYEDVHKHFEVFRGRVFSISTDFNKCKTVTCEGTLAYLVDTVQKVKLYKGKVKTLLERILAQHNEMITSNYHGSDSEMPNYLKRKLFSLGRFEIDNLDVVIPGPKEDENDYYISKYAQAIIESVAGEWLTTYDFINDVIIDYTGGYLVSRYDSTSGQNILDVLPDDSLSDDYVTPAAGKPRQIEFGQNLLDISEEINPEDLCTVVIPLGDSVDNKPLTIEKATNAESDANYSIYKVNGKKIGIMDKAAADKYGLIFKTNSFSNVSKANTLFTDGKRWLKRRRNIPIRYTIKAVDMSFVDVDGDTSPVQIGEMISVRSGPHDLDAEILCTKVEYDLENIENTTYTLGNPEQSLTERYKRNKKKQDKKSRGGSRSAGATAAKAAGDAQETADDALKKAEEIDEKLKGAEIAVDPDNASITLKTWYKQASGAMSRAGLDIDGAKGTVDVYATWEGVKANEKSAADLLVKANELEALIQLLTEKHSATADALAQIRLRTTDTESVIEQLAEFKTKDALTQAAINAKADANGATLDMLTSWKDRANNSINSLAQIGLKADANEAAIKLQAEFNKETNSSLASLNVRATALESAIEQMARFTTESVETTAQITAKANEHESFIELLNEFKNKVTGQLKGLAKTKQWVDEHSSGIEQVTQWYADNGNTSLTKLTQLSNDDIAKIKLATEFYGKNSTALSSIQTWTDETSSNVLSATSYVNNRTGENGERELDVSRTRIEQKADANSAHLGLIAEFTTKGGKTTASFTLDAMKDITGQLKSVAKLRADIIEIISNKYTLLNNVTFTNNNVMMGNSGTTVGLNVTGATTIGGSLGVTGGVTLGSEGYNTIVQGKLFIGVAGKGESKSDTEAATKGWVKDQLDDYAKSNDLKSYVKKKYDNKGNEIKPVYPSDLASAINTRVATTVYNGHTHYVTVNTLGTQTKTTKP